MSRRELREHIFKMLFRVEFHEKEEMSEQLRLFLDTVDELEEEDESYIQTKYDDILAHLEEIDAIVNESTENWKTSRMAKVDLTLIRLAVYEIRYEESVPTGVAINEAVELAKLYGEDSSPAFINGVLARIA